MDRRGWMSCCWSLAWALGACGARNDSVGFVSPSATVHTRDTVTVQLLVDVPSPERVELLRDGAPLVVLTPPYQYTWDTRDEAEGSHELVARVRVDGKELSSEARTVVVDRTPPALIALTPTSRTDNVWPEDPVRLRFSEPLDPASVAGPVATFSMAGEGEWPAQLSLSGDGLELTALPLGGTSAHSASLVLDAAGRPVVAWVEGSTIVAQRWLGSSWAPLGDGVGSLQGPAPVSGTRLTVGPSGHLGLGFSGLTHEVWTAEVVRSAF